MSKNEELKRSVGEKLIEMVEKTGVAFWTQPWCFEGMDLSYGTGKQYRGINTLILNMERMANGYTSKVWLTFNQIKALQKQGKQVSLKKGSVSAPITYWDIIKKMEEDADGEEKEKKIFFLKKYLVFNASCVEGLDVSSKEPKEPAYDEAAVKDCMEVEKTLLSKYEKHPGIRRGGDAAFYSPHFDYIQLPEAKMFKNETKVDAYLSTLAHELAHSTGHEKRLNRKVENKFGSEKYSYEELVAECTASMVCAHFGKTRTFDNSVAYLKSWLSHIKKNPTALYDAIADASKAFDYMMGIKKAEA